MSEDTPKMPWTSIRNYDGPTECTCDPCGDRECECWGKRCEFCQEQDG